MIDGCAQAVIRCVLSEDIRYETDPATGNTVNNKFTGEDAVDGVSLNGSDSGQEIVWLTRADFEGTFPAENIDSRAMPENIAELNIYTEGMAESWIDPDDDPITTGPADGTSYCYRSFAKRYQRLVCAHGKPAPQPAWRAEL
ncbi:MAG: hypothetical protein LUG99_03915 [Lachnospiraceae bacterium]|nr:hypothetical protein [Lachnospiraceae bacterium]